MTREQSQAIRTKSRSGYNGERQGPGEGGGSKTFYNGYRTERQEAHGGGKAQIQRKWPLGVIRRRTWTKCVSLIR